MVKELFNNDIDMQSLQLMTGDYLIGENICIERKSVKDFIDSLVDKRIFKQLTKMKNEYKKPILLVEGGENIYNVRKVHPNAIRGLILTILVDYNIPIIFSKNENETAEYIINLLKRINKPAKPLLKTNKKILTSDVQKSIISNIPGLGVKNSKILLNHFKTIKSIFNASINELLEVEGIGKKIANEIFEISNKEYKD